MRSAALAALLFATVAEGTSTKKGVISLDAFTFDKVIESQKAVLVKFDVEYPYGDKEDQWKKLGARVAAMRGKAGFLMAEVGVQDYGEDKYNERLRDRFGMKKEDFPAIRLFKGNANAPAATFSVSSEEFDEKGLADFVKAELGVDLGEIKREPKKTADDNAASESRTVKPQYMEIHSADMTFLSGIYTLIEGETHNSEPVWGLEDLRVFANNQGTWMMSDVANLKEDRGYVYSKNHKASQWPTEHNEWLFYDGEKSEWVDTTNLTIAVSGPPPPPGLLDLIPDIRTLSLVAAVVLFILAIFLYCQPEGGEGKKDLPR